MRSRSVRLAAWYALAATVTLEPHRIVLSSVLATGIWRVSVEDQGAGVPEEQRERIFERFVRLDTASGGESGGGGLGLAICKSIIELHKGRIRAEAGPGGRGLRVVFEIPA